MEKRLTDNEIIKALEEYIELRFDDTNYATVRLDTLTNALDLINRLQSKNERLSKITRPLIAEIKAEAYMECIAKVKEKSKKTEIVCSGALVTTDYAISNKNLDKLLKEMVGDSDDS